MNKLDRLAQSIAHIEGYGNKKSLAFKNNNPGNLMYAGQKNSIKTKSSRFAVFKTPDDGWNALKQQIKLDALRGKTLEQFIYKYAPPTENNSKAYVSMVSLMTGINPSNKLSDHVK